MERIMTKLNLTHIEECIDDYDLFLFDLWGVIIEGGETYPGVVEVLNKIIKKKDVKLLKKEKKLSILSQRLSHQLGHPHLQSCKGRDRRKEKKKKSDLKKRKLFL